MRQRAIHHIRRPILSVNVIDPEPLVIGKRLYVYFGGGKTSSLGGNMSGVILLRTYRLP